PIRRTGCCGTAIVPVPTPLLGPRLARGAYIMSVAVFTLTIDERSITRAATNQRNRPSFGRSESGLFGSDAFTISVQRESKNPSSSASANWYGAYKKLPGELGLTPAGSIALWAGGGLP